MTTLDPDSDRGGERRDVGTDGSGTTIKAALLVAMVAAVVVGNWKPSLTPWYALALLLFGGVNVVFSTRQPANLAAIASTIATLLWPSQLLVWMALFVFLIWPVWMFLARERATDKTPIDDAPLDIDPDAGLPQQVGAAVIIMAVATASVAYRLLIRQRLEQSAALFIGIPTLLAFLVVFRVKPRTASGVACKAITIALLLSMLFLWEGALCVVMAAPLFYAIGLLIGAAMDFARRKDKRTQSFVSCVAIVALVPMSLEGVTDSLSFNRDEWVVRTAIVRASSDAVGRAILGTPRFDRALPLYLRMGFPRPTATRIDRTSASRRWIVTMTGGEMLLNGMEHRVGSLTLELDEMRSGFARFRVVGDDSHLTHFLNWRESEIAWTALSLDTTKVSWRLRYRRGLDPAWYFGPWERYAAGLAAGYLIESVATP